jgi:hypothetical protein
VDDFCGEGQNSRMNPLKNQRRTLFHTIDKVFRPNDAFDNSSRKEPISISKLQKGDAALHDKKRFLGWDFHGSDRELHMAEHRREKALLHLDALLAKSTANRKEWEQILGELRSLVPGIPGSHGQFSVLQEAISKGRSRVKVRGAIRLQLKTFRALLLSSTRPTSMYELVYGHPVYTGASDAAKAGMGGVWFVGDEALLWRAPFPPEVQLKLVSTRNPRGTVTNSDLELAATIAQHHILDETGYPLQGESTHTFCDNTPAVAWQTKGSTSTTHVTADLLRHAALHQRDTGHVQRFEHLAGERNVMADDASRLWSKDDTNILAYFNSTYPQTKPWQLRHLSPPVLSKLTSLLCRRKWQPALPSSAAKPKKPIGKSGFGSAPNSTLTLASSMSATPSPFFKSSCAGSEMESSLPVVSPSQLATLRTRPAQWARRWPNWGPGTTERIPERGVSTFALLANRPVIANETSQSPRSPRFQSRRCS